MKFLKKHDLIKHVAKGNVPDQEMNFVAVSAQCGWYDHVYKLLYVETSFCFVAWIQ